MDPIKEAILATQDTLTFLVETHDELSPLEREAYSKPRLKYALEAMRIMLKHGHVDQVIELLSISVEEWNKVCPP